MFLWKALLMMSITGLQGSPAALVETETERLSVVPRPTRMEALPGEFCIAAGTQVLVDAGNDEVRSVGEYLAERVKNGTGLVVPIRQSEASAAPDGAIKLTALGADSSLGDEGYELTVTPNALLLRAPQPCGLFRGVQTLRQLLPPEFEGAATHSATRPTTWKVPCVRIVDQPRYRWRGMMLDCCRHFMTKEFVKRYIDLLAYHKMNVLHWHLTEDQGWRIEIKRYPRLTEVGAWRRDGDQRYGGFYTQDDVREVVAYAASRYISVVPEIEMPGHSTAALASYPELSCTGGPHEVTPRWGIFEDVYCAGNDKTFEFLEGVLSEVIELFPSTFIHVGGDECPKTRWSACPKCQARIQAEGLEDEHELQSYFIRRIEKFLNAKGRRLVGWDEILEGGLAPNATVQSWRGMNGAVAAATAGHDVISSPTSHCYLDYAQARTPGEPTRMGFISLETAYAFEPTPAELTPERARHVLGAEGNMWTEHAPQERVDHQVFPRLCALAEVTWSPVEARDWDDFSRRMKRHYRRLDALGVTYFVSQPHCATGDRVFTESMEVPLENPFGRGEIRYTLDGSDPTSESPRYAGPLRLTESTEVKARVFLDVGRSTDVAAFRFVKQSPREPVAVSDAIAGLSYTYYEGAWERLPDLDKLAPAATGTTDTFDLSVRKREDEFAIRFTGYIEVPADGIYTFSLASDDGSKLWIDSDVVVDHDGMHRRDAGERQGQIILKTGKHPITVAMFDARGRQHLEVQYEGPGVPKQPLPASALWHSR